MKRAAICTALLCLGFSVMAQDVHYDYDRATDFSKYGTYHWAAASPDGPNQLVDQNIKRAIDSQLASRGLRRVEHGGDLRVSYKTAIAQEKQFTGLGAGPRWYANGRVTSSTIETGVISVDIFDPSRTQLIWRGWASKTLDIKANPDRNYQNLQKGMAKLFRHYPPGAKKQ